MLTVHRTGSTTDPCTGKTLIEVETADNPSTDFCTPKGSPGLEQVWVNSNTPSIASSYAAGNPIFTSADCTVCAPDGFYKDVLQPMSGAISYYYFKNCNWNAEYTCNERQQVTIRGNTNRTNLCAGLGTLQTAYLDVNFTPYGPFTTNSIYTTHGLYASGAGTAAANIPYQYYSTTNPVIQQQASNVNWTIFWTANMDPNNGGVFGTPQTCGGGGGGSLYYSVALRYNQYSPISVCDTATSTYYLEDGDNFEAGSRLYTNNSGTYAPNGFYVSTAPYLDDGNGRPILRITHSNGLLVATEYYCADSSGLGPREIEE